MTGKQLTAKIFIGPTFYQRLKHLVDDKVCMRGVRRVCVYNIYVCILYV